MAGLSDEASESSFQSQDAAFSAREMRRTYKMSLIHVCDSASSYSHSIYAGVHRHRRRSRGRHFCAHNSEPYLCSGQARDLPQFAAVKACLPRLALRFTSDKHRKRTFQRHSPCPHGLGSWTGLPAFHEIRRTRGPATGLSLNRLLYVTLTVL